MNYRQPLIVVCVVASGIAFGWLMVEQTSGPKPKIIVNTGQILPAVPVVSGASLRAEQERFSKDRTALKKKKPKIEADVEAIFERDPDQCMDMGSSTMCQWFYATKPPSEGRDVIVVTTEGGKVINTLY